MRIADVMTRNVYTIREWEELGLTSDLMRFRRFRHLPVLDSHDKVIGMVARVDLVEAASAPGNPRLRPVYDVMRRPPVTVAPDTEVEEAVRTMRDKQIHSLPVVDGEGTLIGIVTDTDLLSVLSGQRLPGGDISNVQAARLMTPDPITIGTDATLGDAAGAILEGGFRHLPVVDTDLRLVGMISERDLRSELGTDLLDWTAVESTRLDEPVTNILVPSPVTVRTHTPLSDILDLFADERIGAVPVLDDEDRLVGIVSYVDVLVWLRDMARYQEAGARPSV